MAGDWIKMRASLESNPKVIAIAKMLESSKVVGKTLGVGFNGALREIVTRDVARDVTVMSLFRVWCAANEHTTDGVWRGIEIEDLDHVARVIGFGRMMESVGWAVFNESQNTVTFPNFLEYNAPAKEGRDKGAAERQRRYREKMRSKSDVTRDVTLRVTRDVTRDVEKRREEKKNISKKKDSPKPSDEFLSWYELYPKKVARGAAIKAYETAIVAIMREDECDRTEAIDTLNELTARLMPALSEKEIDFIPNPASWLNSQRYRDAVVKQRVLDMSRPEFAGSRT